MASTNRVLSPPSTSDPAKSPPGLASKRKRNPSVDIPNHINGSSDSDGVNTIGGIIQDSQALVKDLVDVLKTHDTSLSILTRTLPDRSLSVEHPAKRQRAEENGQTSTNVLARASLNTYKNIDEVLEDIDLAVADVLDKLQISGEAARNQRIQLSPEKTELAVMAKAFKKRAHDLVQKDKAVWEKQTTGSSSHPNSNSAYVGNGGLVSNAVMQITANSSDKSVLTLYANAPGPKQLFSSLQKPLRVAGKQYVVAQPLREATLPNGIYTTQVVPIESAGLNGDKKRTAILGEVFKTPATVPSLQPPKPSKVSTTRSLTVGWYQPATADPAPKHGTYSRQNISTGQWLDYGSTAVNPGAKRRQRDRTMSLSGARGMTDIEGAEVEGARLDALFRSAYSGFAPTKDNTAAMATDGVLNRLWWQQVGERNFERMVSNVASTEGTHGQEGMAEKTATGDGIDEVESFRQAVEAYENQAIDPSLLESNVIAERSIEEKDIDEILEGVSELIATLNSFQRNRHLVLNPPSRAVGLLSASDTSSLGTPSKPSDQEQATYEILKSQLTLLIASLPPYAVAKLDSDKLAELSISTKLEIQAEDNKGVMEEDEIAARAKGLSLGTASSSRPPHSASIHRSTSSALYGNQYTPARSTAPYPQQYHGSNQTPIRPPSSNMPRPQSSVPYPPQRSTAPAAYRPNNYASPTYPHQSARPAQQPYTAGGSAQFPLQAVGSQNHQRQQSQPHHNSPQQASQPYPSSRYSGQPHAPQGAANLNNNDFRYPNTSSIARQGSPQRPLYSPQLSTATRQSYSIPNPATPQNRSYPQTSTVNGGSAQMQQSQAPSVSTPYSTFMTQEQQDSMMERQRQQLAQQQGAQQQARTAAQAGVLGSPSKAHVNGTSAVSAV